MTSRTERSEAQPPPVGPLGPPLARSAGAAIASLAILGALAVALVASTQRVPGPSGWSYSALEAWVDRQPVSAAFCVVSTMALLVVLYLMVSTVAVLVARAAQAARLPGLERVAETLAVPVIRRALAALLGLGLTAAVSGPSAHGAAPPATSAGIATMHALEPAEPPASVGSPASPSPSPAPLARAPSPDVWTIEPGDHLWGLAEAALRSAWSRDPHDSEVADYLYAIVDLNREVLVVPDHPDLVLPGQVFTRPALAQR